MKIGDEVYIHGYVDEIRKDTVIIRNDGGYFGTVREEVVTEIIEPYEAAAEPKQSRQDALEELMEYTYGMLTTEKFGLQHKIKSMMDAEQTEPQTEWNSEVEE